MASIKNLNIIADNLRKDTLIMTTMAGSGHPSSCLSIAEIMSTLFFDEMRYDVEDPNNKDNDEFILSKGHAAPILYASLKLAKAKNTEEPLLNLRKLGSSYEGHPVPSSFPWAKVATGSLGQGLSVGVGMAISAKIQKRKFRTYVLCGDGEVAEGSVYEAMEIASLRKLDNLCVIIDVNRLGQTGETMIGHKLKIHEQRFKAFGGHVIKIDGHNIFEIKEALQEARKTKNKPTIILAKTFKGKGVSFMENKEDWHGKPVPKDKLEEALLQIPYQNTPEMSINKPLKYKNSINVDNTKINYKKINFNFKKGQEIATREAYGDILFKLAKKNKSIIVVDAEVKNSTFADSIEKISKERVIETFIAEQNMVDISLGMSKKGFDVYCSTFAAFFTRAHDQIRMAGLSDANITFAGSHCGVSIGEDGSSQMGLEDISMFRSIPNSIVVYPSDAVSTEKLVEQLDKERAIKYIRTSRPKTPVIYSKDDNFLIGNFKVVKNNIINKKANKKILIASCGVTLFEAIKASEKLEKQGIFSTIIDCYSIKPFKSIDKFVNLLKKAGNNLIIIEDHYPEGGLGEALKSALFEKNTKNIFKICHLAVNKIPHSGSMKDLLRYTNIDSSSIIRTAKKMLN